VRNLKSWLIASLVMVSPAQLHAFDPQLNLIMPRGGTRGQELEIHLHGNRMHEPQELLFYNQGITVKSLTKVDAKNVKAKLVIAADTPLGEHAVRLRCKGGITYMRTLWIGQFPVLNEIEPNHPFSKPQLVPMNHTVHGTSGLEDVDYYRVTAKKGQRISVEIEAMRLGGVFFDPYIAVLDSKRFELATSDDTSLLKQDAFVSLLAPADGDYIILVRESAYEGNDKCRYRLHIGSFTRPSVLYPPAAAAGKDVLIKMIGDPTGDYEVKQTIQGDEGSLYPVFAQKDGLSAPSPNHLLVSSMPFFNEQEPNNGWKNIKQEPKLTAPCAFHGIIGEKGDRDFFRFHAKKNQNLRIQVISRALRSPLDSVLVLRDTKGKKSPVLY